MDQWRNQRGSKKYLKTNGNKSKINGPKPMWSRKSSSKREVYSNTVLSQDTGKITNKQPNFTSKMTRERRTNKT